MNPSPQQSTLSPTEVELRELKDFLVTILSERWPKEARVLAKLPPSVLSQWTASSKPATALSHGFGDVLEVSVAALHVIGGTIAFWNMYRTRQERVEQNRFELEFQEEWRTALVDAGMSVDIATQIPAKYGRELIRFLLRHRRNPKDE